jgi:hypothetical protein
MAYTSSDLIDAVKSLASIPSSQNLFATADFLRFANRSLSLVLSPMLKSVREEYHVVDYDYNIAADQTSYRIPRFAAGDALRDVKIIDSAGNEESLSRAEPEQITGEERSFFVKGNSIVLAWTPSGSEGTLRLSYTRRPGKLVATSATAVVTSISGTNVTVSSVPSTFTTAVQVDMIEANPGFDWLATDTAIAGVSGTTLTFASVPTDLAIGDYIALAGESPVIQLPLEMHALLEQHVAIQCMRAQDKKSAAKDMQEDFDVMEQRVLTLLTPRVVGEPKKIVTSASLLSHFSRGC